MVYVLTCAFGGKSLSSPENQVQTTHRVYLAAQAFLLYRPIELVHVRCHAENHYAVEYGAHSALVSTEVRGVSPNPLLMRRKEHREEVCKLPNRKPQPQKQIPLDVGQTICTMPRRWPAFSHFCFVRIFKRASKQTLTRTPWVMRCDSYKTNGTVILPGRSSEAAPLPYLSFTKEGTRLAALSVKISHAHFALIHNNCAIHSLTPRYAMRHTEIDIEARKTVSFRQLTYVKMLVSSSRINGSILVHRARHF